MIELLIWLMLIAFLFFLVFLLFNRVANGKPIAGRKHSDDDGFLGGYIVGQSMQNNDSCNHDSGSNCDD